MYTREYMEDQICKKILSYAIILEGVPIEVARVSNSPLAFYMCIDPQPYVYPLNEKPLYLKTSKHVFL